MATLISDAHFVYPVNLFSYKNTVQVVPRRTLLDSDGQVGVKTELVCV